MMKLKEENHKYIRKMSMNFSSDQMIHLSKLTMKKDKWQELSFKDKARLINYWSIV